MSVDGGGLFDVEWAEIPEERTWSMGLWLGGASAPLVLYDQMNGGNELGALVSHRLQAAVMGSYSLGEVEVGAELPMILSQSGDAIEGVETGGGLAVAGLGDLRLVAKVRLLDRRETGFDLSVIPALKLPTAGGDEYLGDDGVSFEPEVAIERDRAGCGWPPI